MELTQVLTPTLRDGLKSYGIGPKIRAIRLKKKMGLVELGKHTGLSAAMLSKIERGQLFPTLPTLLRVALVFSVGLDYFFSGNRDKPVVGIVRRKDRLRFREKPDTRDVAYEFESLDFPAVERRMNSYLAEFMPVADDKVRPHAHPGGEFLYVLSGTLEMLIGDEAHQLNAGDSIYFDSSVPHAYRRSGAKPCSAIVVTSTSAV
jgi:mannose-6-phosphate isomerase-like protein (cupin superfamily)